MMQSTPQSPWDNQNIVLISAEPSSFPEEVLARLERRQWITTLRTGKVTEAFRALKEGVATLLLIHDTPELPASLILRAQIADPLAIITPTVVVCHPAHQQEISLLKDMGSPDVVESPVNPSAFITSFEWLLRKWTQGNFQKLYKARRQYIENQQVPFGKTLTALRTEGDIQALTTASLARTMMHQADLKSVEKLLLSALKEHPRSLTIILSLVEFYLRASMPETSLKILGATRKNFGNPRLLFPDQIQAHLMLNQVKESIPLLEAMVREDYARKSAQTYLARCLYAEGHLERFQKVIENQILMADDFKNRWNKVAG